MDTQPQGRFGNDSSPVLTMLVVSMFSAGLCFVSTSRAQEATSEDPSEPSSLEVAGDGLEDFVELPRMIIQQHDEQWRLPDEEREALWREVRGERDVELQPAAVTTIGKGRMKLDLLPYYDPANPHEVDLGVDESRTEIVEVFRLRF